MAIQRADGSFPDPDRGIPHLFDSGQILRGLIDGIELDASANDAASRTAEYICENMIDEGRGGFRSQYTGDIPEAVLLYVLPPLVKAGDILNKPVYIEKAYRCADYYLTSPDALKPEALTHFLAYQIEALIDLGRTSEVLPILDGLRKSQSVDGSVPGVFGTRWICTPGLAQLAICWYKTNQTDVADRAMAWLEAHQRQSGGFLGSVGAEATYFPHSEISWAVKFYLDAHLLRVAGFFNQNAHIFPSEIETKDERLAAILSVVKAHDRVLEVGCGKGRFLKAVSVEREGTECVGVDISPALLKEVPAGIGALLGSLESVPCDDNSFDVVFSVEAIEHSANPERAVEELVRVVRPGGWIIVIDKDHSQLGRLKTLSWESWPSVSQIKSILHHSCDNVTADPVGYDGRPPSDGLMTVWRGQKRSPLSGAQWNEELISAGSQKAILARLQANKISEWGQTIAAVTKSGQTVLEIGSGTGEITLHLARTGRIVTAMDIDAKSLAFTERCAKELDVIVETVLADATQPLPFSNDHFQCVWSSGLLEHFVFEDRVKMLREWARVCSQTLVNFVPNAASVAYRAGKHMQEGDGTWPYGLEMPIHSLRPDYEAAGLRVEKEFSIGVTYALNFLPANDGLRASLTAWMKRMGQKELDDCNQGYLLVTIGTKQI